MCNNAIISNLTPTSTHNEPYTLSGRTATAPSALYLLFPLYWRSIGEREDIFHLACSFFGIWFQYIAVSIFFQSVSVFIPIFSKGRYFHIDIFELEIAHAYSASLVSGG